MAFWKKSDDPWDRKPEKKTGAAWREPPEPREEVVPVVENCVENVEKSVETVEVCPWCGGEMELGYLCGGRGVYYQSWQANGRRFRVDNEGGLFYSYRRTWYCRKCERMVMNAAGMEDESSPLSHKPLSYREQMELWGVQKATEYMGEDK